jgi:hypothetical protein
MEINRNSAICVEGYNYENEQSMPEEIRVAFEHVLAGALTEKHALFHGSKARVVPKLNCRIVCDSKEFGDASDLTPEQRRLYEESISKLLPGYFAARVAQVETRLQRRNKLFVACISLAASMSYLWYHGCLSDSKFVFHFIRFLCGLK